MKLSVPQSCVCRCAGNLHRGGERGVFRVGGFGALVGFFWRSIVRQHSEFTFLRTVRDALSWNRVETCGVNFIFNGWYDAHEVHVLGAENFQNCVDLGKRFGIRHKKVQRWMTTSIRQ